MRKKEIIERLWALQDYVMELENRMEEKNKIFELTIKNHKHDIYELQDIMMNNKGDKNE